MALSYYSNLAAIQHLNQEMGHSNVLSDICFCDNCVIPNTLADPFFNPDDFICAENNTHFLPHFSDSDPSLHFPPEIIPTDAVEFDLYHQQKRLRGHDDFYPSDFAVSPYDHLFGASHHAPEFLPKFMFPAAESQIPKMVMGYSSGADISKKSNGASLSTQSVAARQRRKKISEKTQQLGKLIPGGNKMNTAEMFQAASKYVKFLQAQVGILQLMGPTGEYKKEEAAHHMEQLQVLLSSPRVQEKLYEEEKCMVPKALVEKLAEAQELQSRPSIIKDLGLLLQSM